VSKPKIMTFLLGFMLLLSTAAMAQYPIVDADQLKARLLGKQKVVLIDARPEEEYQQAHIPGAVNIRADRIKDETARLPKDKAASIIFYCRGEG
jgi:rhodanese-related sulfurtransferase